MEERPVVSNASTSDSPMNNDGATNRREEIQLDELCALMNKAQKDPAYYKQLYERVFVVRLQQHGPKEYFNIEKRKKRAKRDDKKVSNDLWFSNCLLE